MVAGWLAQTSAQPQSPQFRTTADYVYIDVSVVDKDRRPIRGLTAQDFIVFENGQPQAVQVFSEVAFPDGRRRIGFLETFSSDVRRNDDVSDRRLIVIVLDDALLPASPNFLRQAREAAKRIVNDLEPWDSAAVVFTRDNRQSQDFTSDKQRLLAAIDRLSIGFAFSGDDSYWQQSSIATLRRLCAYLAEVPRRRKVVFYVSTGFPVDIEQVAKGTLTATRLHRELLETLRWAQSGNVAIYPVDPAGVGGLSGYLMRRNSATHAIQQARHYLDSLRVLASETGGRAIIERNDIAVGIDEVFVENAGYYLLGYRTSPVAESTYRRLEVTVRRPDAVVRARNSYQAQPAPISQEDSQPLRSALSGLLPEQGLPMSVTAASFRAGRSRNAAVVIAILLGGRDPQVEGPVGLRVEAFNMDGRSVGAQEYRVSDVPSSSGVELARQLELGPGRYQVRVGARAERTGLRGSVYYDLEVPDFSRDAMLLSDVVWVRAETTFSSPSAVQAPALSVVPTTRRVFARTDKPTLLFHVYQRGRAAPTQLQLEIRDALGQAAHVEGRSIPADQFLDSVATASFSLPLMRLTPQSYVVVITAVADRTTVVRHTRFDVR